MKSISLHTLIVFYPFFAFIFLKFFGFFFFLTMVYVQVNLVSVSLTQLIRTVHNVCKIREKKSCKGK